MKFTQEEVKELLELVGAADEFLPLLEAVKEKAPTFEPYLKSLVTYFTENWVKAITEMVKRFETEGFTHDEAVMFTIEIIRRTGNK